MFGFIKKMFIAAMTFVGCGALISSSPLKCVSISNQECNVKSAMVNINSNEPLFYPYSVLVNKCSGNCDDIDNPYAILCFPDVVKNINIKVFNLMSRTNETRYVSWHETCACKCRLDASVCNDKQGCNNDKSRCGCKEIIDKGKCDDGFIWNPRIRERGCEKLCNVTEYLDCNLSVEKDRLIN